MENVQLIKKRRQGGYKDIFPRTFLNAIRDKESGVTLTEILQGFNMYFLSHTGNRESTRLQIPFFLRREGLWITYVLYDHTVITEWYNSEKIDDESWKSDSNWRVGSNALVGDISISSDGYWVINGIVSETKAQGEQGVTPLLRIGDNNKLQVSYNEGKQWNDISDLIVPKFRWLQGEGTTAGTVQISMDLGKTWSNLSNPISNNLRIKKYIGINESLPTSGVEEGTIYMKGPYYAEDDTLNENPIYRMWVYAWKGNTLAWQDNGEFTSISAGVVQETGNSETEVMSQKAVTEELFGLEKKLNNLSIAAKKTDAIKGNSYYGTYGLTSSASWESYIFENNSYSKVICLQAISNMNNIDVISFFSDTPSNETYIGGVKHTRSELASDYETDIPEDCKYVMISSRVATQPMGEIYLFIDSVQAISKQIKEQKEDLEKEIGNILNITYTLSDFEEIYPGYYTSMKSDGTLPINSSGSWHSWIMQVNGGEVINAKLGRSDHFQSCIVFLNSNIIDTNNVVDFVRDTNSIGEVEYNNIVVPNGAKYVLLCNRTANCSNPSATLVGNADLRKIVDNTAAIKKLESSKSFVLRGAFGSDFVVGETSGRAQTLRVGSDSTFIDDYRLTFFAFDAEPECELRIQKFDNGYTNSPTVDKVCYHKFNHCNTIDYNRYNDCLIFGNGGAIYADDAEFYVIPNAKEVFVNASPGHIFTFENTPHIKFNCVPYNMGQKMQALWGERNGMSHNIVYLITNDNADIYKVLLGVGSIALSKGVFISVNDEKSFNGTFEILKTYHQEMPSKHVNQGSQFFKGRIVCGTDGSGINILTMTLKDDGTILTDSFSQQIYGDDGSLLNRATNSLCIDNEGNVIVGCLLLYEGASNRAIVFKDYNW